MIACDMYKENGISKLKFLKGISYITIIFAMMLVHSSSALIV